MFIRNDHNSLKAHLIRKRGSKCEKCGLETSDLILDHKIPIAIGGPEFDENNVWLLCKKCDKEKTKRDQGKIAVGRKVEKVLTGGQTQLVLN